MVGDVLYRGSCPQFYGGPLGFKDRNELWVERTEEGKGKVRTAGKISLFFREDRHVPY